MAKAARGIQSIEISGRILKALVDVCEPMMLKDLAKVANLAPAQCHAYLTSMRHIGLVYQEPDSGLYRMGPFAMRLGIGWLRSSPVPAATAQALKSLTAELGFMSLIAVWGEFGPTVVHINEGTWVTALNIRQGTLFSLTGTATGRIFSAFGDAADLQDRVNQELVGSAKSRAIGPASAREDFDAQVKLARRKGFSVAKGAPIPDINAISAPVFDQNGTFAFVATLVGPSAEMPVEESSPAVQRLLETTRAIPRSLAPDAELRVAAP